MSEIRTNRGQKWDTEDKNWSRNGQKQEFYGPKIVKKRTRTQLSQNGDKKWTEGGQILDRGQKMDKKWDTDIDMEHLKLF